MKLSDSLLHFAVRYPALRPVYRLTTKIRERLIMFSAAAASALFLLVLLGVQGRLTVYLHTLEASAIYQLATAVGAALIGLIGVVFTLTLFVIQQISNSSIPGLLREYAADKRTQWIFICLACLALLALSATLIVPRTHPFAPIFLIVVAVLGTLGLLWALFERVIVLSDHSHVI
jgi:uncharacterized membrane protein